VLPHANEGRWNAGDTKEGPLHVLRAPVRPGSAVQIPCGGGGWWWCGCQDCPDVWAGPTRMAGYTLTASEMSMLTATAGDASNDSSRCTSFDLAAWMRASAIVRSHALFAHTHIHIPLDS
jgi:hypothetical protein